MEEYCEHELGDAYIIYTPIYRNNCQIWNWNFFIFCRIWNAYAALAYVQTCMRIVCSSRSDSRLHRTTPSSNKNLKWRAWSALKPSVSHCFLGSSKMLTPGGGEARICTYMGYMNRKLPVWCAIVRAAGRKNNAIFILVCTVPTRYTVWCTDATRQHFRRSPFIRRSIITRTIIIIHKNVLEQII